MSRKEEIVRSERNAIGSALRRWAKDNRDDANAMMAETTQNKVLADLRVARALALEGAADNIEAGRHWW